jgi:hypothetical protein
VCRAQSREAISSRAAGRGSEAGRPTDIDNTEGHYLAVVLAHRKILALPKDMVAEAVDRLIVLRSDAERKDLGVATLVLELPNLIALALPKAMHRAYRWIVVERGTIKATVFRKRQREGVAMACAALGKFVAACKFQTDSHRCHVAFLLSTTQKSELGTPAGSLMPPRP